jgi:hypothetical protein
VVSIWAGFISAGDARPGEDFEVCDLPSGAYAVSILAMGKTDLDLSASDLRSRITMSQSES